MARDARREWVGVSMYAFVIDNEIQSVGGLPGSARILATRQWLCPPGGLANATVDQREACGYYAVVDEPPQFDPQTQVLTRGEAFLSDPSTPMVMYTIRPKTADQLATEAEARARAEDLERKGINVGQAVATLRQWADDADAVTVTTGNAVQVLQVTLDRMGVFFDRFADLIEHQGLGSSGGR